MKLSKDTWTIVAILGIAFLVYWIMSKNKKEESGFKRGKTRKEFCQYEECFGKTGEAFKTCMDNCMGG